MEILSHSEELKLNTRSVHHQLEMKLIPIIQSVSTPSQYVFLLKTFYTFYAPLEKQLSSVFGIEDVTSTFQLRKVESLKEDIFALDATAEELPLCQDLPQCSDLSTAFGILYVMEGSVLGGKGIASIISKNLTAESSLPFHFFLYYGDDQKAMWNKFKDALDSKKNLSRQTLLSSAAETFVKFKTWIDKRYTFFGKDPGNIPIRLITD